MLDWCVMDIVTVEMEVMSIIAKYVINISSNVEMDLASTGNSSVMVDQTAVTRVMRVNKLVAVFHHISFSVLMALVLMHVKSAIDILIATMVQMNMIAVSRCNFNIRGCWCCGLSVILYYSS